MTRQVAENRAVTAQPIQIQEMHMKFAHARIVTEDVPALVRFYRELTGMTPVGDDRYAELHGPQLSLAISSQRMIDLHSAGAATPRSNRSMILDFEVDDVDQEHARLDFPRMRNSVDVDGDGAHGGLLPGGS